MGAAVSCWQVPKAEINLSIQLTFVPNPSALQRLPDRSAVLCSWGVYVEYVYAAVLASGKTLWTAGLARGGLSERVWQNLSYSVMPDDKACA